MRYKFYFLILLFSLTTTYSFAKPMCKILYDRIYEEADFYDVSIPTYENKKSIGIRLEKVWNKEKIYETRDGEKKENMKSPGYELAKNTDGYYKVGKITDPLLHKTSADYVKTKSFFEFIEDMYYKPDSFKSPEKIEVGDVILSINDIDLRSITDYERKKKLLNNVSDLFETNELIKFELLKKYKNKFKKVIVDRTGTSKTPNIRNTLKDFDAPLIDFFVKSITIDEKKGTFTATIEKNHLAKIDKRHSLTKIIHEELIKKKEYKEGNLTNFRWYQCPYPEQEWEDLDSISLTYGMKFDKLISQDNSLKKSFYNIRPNWEYDFDNWKKFINSANAKNFEMPYLLEGAEVAYNSTGVYTFQSDFNLKTFPFDKQTIKIFLYNEKYDIDNLRALFSSFSLNEANKFAETNTIPGWNIDNVDLNYKIFEKINTDNFSGFSGDSGLHDGILYEVEISRKSGYYIFKIILPILLILMICWSAVWIDPKEIESRLTITIVCLLSLIAYNFVIDSDLPKLEYLTIMDYIILISYIYAAIPNFLSIYSFQLLKKNKALTKKYEFYEKKYGLPSYILIIFLIVIINASSAPDHTNSMFTWASMR